MSKDMDVRFEFDPKSMGSLFVALHPDLHLKAMQRVAALAILVGDRAAKKATPVETGHARRSTVADTRRLVLEGRYPYLDWLDTGEDSRGRVMSGWRRGGYQIRKHTQDQVNAELPNLIDRAGREIQKRWAK